MESPVEETQEGEMTSEVRRMQQTSVDGVQLEYEESGSGETIVLVHGFFGPDVFVPLTKEPALSGYHLIRYRRRGYERSSPATGAVSVADEAADCARLLRNLGVKRAHAVGHSYGGVIALQLALDAPDLVHSLVLIEPALLLLVPGGQAMMGQMAPLIELYGRGEKAGAVEGFLQGVGGPDVGEAAESAIPGSVDQAVRAADNVFQVEMPALQAWEFPAADARRITQPVLHILGGDSLPPFREIKELIHERLPQTEDFTVPRADHLSQLFNPRNVAEAIARFSTAHPLPLAARS
jgi:3-oxoadipate enol-lactonase